MQKAVKTKARKVGMVEVERRRKEERSRKETRIKEDKKREKI